LTGLLNRRSLDDALNRLGTDGDSDVVCMMVDIDHFKRFNDEFGHDAGDDVMRRVSAMLSDTVGPAGNAYRFGGEEFAILFGGMSEDAAFALGEKLRMIVDTTPIAYRGRLLGSVTISIGMASTGSGAPSATVLLRADAALLKAKSQGRNMTITDWGGKHQSSRRLAV
jgi:diguanylate cyclase (GGDEF)-like protein